jgi:glycosyltransferase involved in cell wall biosynthesis
MISICIPVYNYDVRNLVESLNQQAATVSAEVILLDDRSADRYREINRQISGEVIEYHELEKNIGRSRIRNRFTEYAKYGHLLFLDCDSGIISKFFLSDYFEAMRTYPEQVICGGRVYPEKSPGRQYRLHWRCGTRRESQPAEVRSRHSNRSFMTNNFLVPARVLRDVQFNEKLLGYGHEDSLFGYSLYTKGVEIRHIDNPVLHEHLQNNAEFLSKTEEAVRSLALITSQIETSRVFAVTISLLRAADKVKNSGMAGFIRILHRILKPLLRFALSRGFANLNLLDFHKLGSYLRVDRMNTSMNIRD